MRASGAQIGLYGVAVVVDTALAIVLGASMAEAAAEIADKKAHGEDARDAGSVLSALATGFAWSILSFIYMLCFLSITQCQPKSPLLWIVTEVCALGVLIAFGLGVAALFTASGLLDMGNCSAGSPPYCSLNVAAGALVWICAFLLVAMFGFTLIYKGMYHPGRQAWGTSLRMLSRKPMAYNRMRTPGSLSLHQTRTSVCTTAHGGGSSEGAFCHENDALRPFLMTHEAPSAATLQTAGQSTTRSSRVAVNTASVNELGAYGNMSESSLRHSQCESSPAPYPQWSPPKGRERVSVDSVSSPTRAHPSRTSLHTTWETADPYRDASPVPPLPAEIAPMPKAVEVMNEDERALESEAKAIKAKAVAALVIRPPTPGQQHDEDTILTASDVYSVMADFAPSPIGGGGSAAAPKTLSDLMRRSSFAMNKGGAESKKEILLQQTKRRSRSGSTPDSRPELVLEGFKASGLGGEGEHNVVFPGPPPAWTPPVKPAGRGRARADTGGRSGRTPLPPLPSQSRQQPPALPKSTSPVTPDAPPAHGQQDMPLTTSNPAPAAFSAGATTSNPATPKRPRLPRPPSTPSASASLPRVRSSSSLPRPPSSSSIASIATNTTTTASRPLPAPPVPPIPSPYRQSSGDAPDGGVYMGGSREGATTPRPLPEPRRTSSTDARNDKPRDSPAPPLPPVPTAPPPSYQ